MRHLFGEGGIEHRGHFTDALHLIVHVINGEIFQLARGVVALSQCQYQQQQRYAERRQYRQLNSETQSAERETLH